MSFYAPIPDQIRRLPSHGGWIHFYVYDDVAADTAQHVIDRGAYERRMRAETWHSRGNGHYDVRLVPQHQAPVACKAGKGQRRKWARQTRREGLSYDAAVAARYAGAALETWLPMLYLARAKRGPKGHRVDKIRYMERWFSHLPKRGERC